MLDFDILSYPHLVASQPQLRTDSLMHRVMAQLCRISDHSTRAQLGFNFQLDLPIMMLSLADEKLRKQQESAKAICSVSACLSTMDTQLPYAGHFSERDAKLTDLRLLGVLEFIAHLRA